MATKKKTTKKKAPKKLTKAEEARRRKRRAVGRAKTVTVRGYTTKTYKRAAPVRKK